jgi:hypothetical protein
LVLEDRPPEEVAKEKAQADAARAVVEFQAAQKAADEAASAAAAAANTKSKADAEAKAAAEKAAEKKESAQPFCQKSKLSCLVLLTKESLCCGSSLGSKKS